MDYYKILHFQIVILKRFRIVIQLYFHYIPIAISPNKEYICHKYVSIQTYQYYKNKPR